MEVCEGRVVIFVKAEQANETLKILRYFHPPATCVGLVDEEARPIVRARTFLGAYRLIDKLSGQQLPRAC